MSSAIEVSSMASPPSGFQEMRLIVQPTARRFGALAGTVMVPCLIARSKLIPHGPVDAPEPSTQSSASPEPRRRTVNSLPSGHVPSQTMIAPLVSAVRDESLVTRLLTMPAEASSVLYPA